MTTKSALIVATDTYIDEGLTQLTAPGADSAELAEVLRDPDIGGFDVQSIVNEPQHQLTRSIAQFFSKRSADDLLWLHLSCHGVKDDSGELYFAATDTTLDLLEATGVSSSFVKTVMERSRAGLVLVFLDCCYSGAFGHGFKPKAGTPVDVNERLGGRGRAVITASSALQFSFEGQQITTGDVAATEPSIFTGALVRGLRTGEADRDRDGWVALDELYKYVYDEVTRLNPNQTPKLLSDVEGDLYVARRGRPVTEPSELPEEITRSMDSPVWSDRLGVVHPLTTLLTGAHPGLSLAARLALERMAAKDDSDLVKQAARAALAAAPLPPPPPRPQPPSIWRRILTALRGPLRRMPRIVLGLALAGLLVASLLVWRALRDDGTTPVSAPLPSGELLMTSGNDLFAVDIVTNDRRLLIDDEYTLSSPNISVDRRWMVYLQDGEGPTRPMLARADGSSVRRLKTGSDCPYTGPPAWSNDGDRLAVVCLDSEDQTTELRIITLEGEVERVLPSLGALRRSPTWTGHDTVIYGESDTAQQPVTLFELPAAGGPPTPLVPDEALLEQDPEWAEAVLSQPDWADAGLLFVRAREHAAPGDIWLLDPDKKVRPLTDRGDVTSVGWGPDGESIVFTTRTTPGLPELTVWIQRPGQQAAELATGVRGVPSWGSR